MTIPPPICSGRASSTSTSTGVSRSPWNAIPWTQMDEKDHDLDLVREWGIIPALLKPMKSLKVVVLLGKGYAWTLEKEIHSLCPDVEILTATTRVTRVSFPSGVSPARSLSTGCVRSLRRPRSTRRRISGVAYSGPSSQWWASPFNAAIYPTSAVRSRAMSLVTSFGSCGPIPPLPRALR
jgi:hypothetical protein